MLLCFVLFLLLSACNAPGPTETASPPTLTASPTETSQPTPTLSPTVTSVPATPTPTEPIFEVCSPLEDETLESLRLIMQNDLVKPHAFGLDFGHPGRDFAYYQRGDRLSIQGVEVYAVLAGKTVLTLEDQYPYGYTILIETLLSDLPPALQETLMEAYLPVPEDLVYQYNCPDVREPTLTGQYSLYHLYAHLEVRPDNQPGDPITCGETLGTVGNSGWSSNPHLHLEMRLGPSGADFRTMAHYDSTATIEQLSNYCLWRSSGYYQIVDPYLILVDDVW